MSQVDLAGYAPRYLGGHHQPRSRDAHFNDNCACIAVRARSTAFTPDMHEVYKAKWEPIANLVAIAEHYIKSPPSPSDLIEGHTLVHRAERQAPFSPIFSNEPLVDNAPKCP